MNTRLLLLLGTLCFLVSCSSGDDDGLDRNVEIFSLETDTDSLATGGCQNVVIVNEFAYAACGSGIEIVDLTTLERNFLSLPADDISADANLGMLFTQSGNILQQFDLVNPMAPNPVTSATTSFLIFSGIASANGVLVVSGGSGGSNTLVYTYGESPLTLVVSGIPLVDSQTGNPDVHVTATSNGALAFYSQDLGEVANWGIQTVEFDTEGNILDLPDVVVLTPGMFTGSFGTPFGPANFPLESEFLDDRLYVAHFAANGIQVIDRSDSTDGSQLFVVGVSRNIVDMVNPVTDTVVDSFTLPLQQPIGVAANATHIAIADRSAGLIIATR